MSKLSAMCQPLFLLVLTLFPRHYNKTQNGEEYFEIAEHQL